MGLWVTDFGNYTITEPGTTGWLTPEQLAELSACCLKDFEPYDENSSYEPWAAVQNWGSMYILKVWNTWTTWVFDASKWMQVQEVTAPEATNDLIYNENQTYWEWEIIIYQWDVYFVKEWETLTWPFDLTKVIKLNADMHLRVSIN